MTESRARPSPDAPPAPSGDRRFPPTERSGPRWSSRLGGAAIVVAIACWVLWRTGPAIMPNLELFEPVAADWPLSSVEPAFGYSLRVPLGPMAYQLVPQPGPKAYVILHAVCLLTAAALLTGWLARRLGLRRALIAYCVLALAPITAVLLNWIGMYDAFSILAFVVLMMSLDRGPRVQFAAAALVGFQNFEQSLVALVIVLLVPTLARSVGMTPRAVPLLAGILAGKAVLETFLSAVGAVSGSRLLFLATDDKAREILTGVASVAPIILWSALGGLWLYAVPAVQAALRQWSRAQLAMAAAAAFIWFGSGIISEDQTRVLAMTSFPAVVLAAIHIALRYRDLPEFVRTPQAWGLILAPPLVLWHAAPLPMGVTIG